MGKKYTSVLLTLLTSSMLFSQQMDSKKLDSLFYLLETNQKFMGSVALSRHGKIIYTNTVDFADHGENKKAIPETIYRTGSISKMFTSGLVLKASRENKLTLDQSIVAFSLRLKFKKKNHYQPFKS